MTDTFTQNYARVGPDGSVLFTFDGKVYAKGLDIEQGQGEMNKIRWVRSGDGSVRAEIFSADAVAGMAIYDNADGSQAASSVDLRAFKAGNDHAQLFLTRDANGNRLVARAPRPPRQYEATILDDVGRSSFLFSAPAGGLGGNTYPAQKRVIDMGVANVAFSGGGFSSVVTINHIFGSVPIAILATVSWGPAGGGLAFVAGAIDPVTSSQFSLRAQQTAGPAYSGQAGIYWIAIA